MLFFEPHPLATVISIFCIPSLFSSFLLLFAPFRLAASVFAVPLNSHSHADASHSSIVSHLLSILRPIISHTLSTLVSYRFSASHCPLIASHLPFSPHSSKHFYFLSHLFRQFLFSLIASLPLTPFIRYRYSPLLVFPASSPRFTLPHPRDQFSFPDARNFLSKPFFYPYGSAFSFYVPLFVSHFHSLLSFPLPRLAPLTAAC